MRPSIQKIEPQVHTSKTGRRYSCLNIGDLQRVEGGGYKLEGAIFATSDTRKGIHAVIEQLMERVDQALSEDT
jgi:hypothetical protein